MNSDSFTARAFRGRLDTKDVDRPEKATVSLTGVESSVATAVDRFVEQCRSCWPADQEPLRVVTRAPGRLDCMGGMADYSGALALQMPIEQAAYVSVGRRDDQKICVQTLGEPVTGEPAQFEWPLAMMYQSDGQFVTTADFAAQLSACPWARHVAGVFLTLLDAGLAPHYAGGVTLMLGSDIPQDAGLASSAAIQLATAKALVSLFETEASDYELLTACRTANAEVVAGEPGLVDHAACLWGEAGLLLQISCQPDTILGTLALPKDVTFAAVESGVRLPIYRQRYADNRLASYLGRYLIERILKDSGAMGDPTGGYLANISPNEYVRRFRNELPVKIKGKDFVSRFGEPEEFKHELQPDQVYKIRSRTEHHIYENDRTHRFIERLGRARRTGERDALVEAGELMYASHWSYGQRCGMGSIETDVLVNMIRQQGAARGLYGAKVTGGGCGGAVAVLMADQPGAITALQEACSAYTEKTGKKATILDGSSPGLASFGVRVLA